MAIATTNETPTTSWNQQAATPLLAPKPLDATALALYDTLLAQTPVSFMDRVSAHLGKAADKAEAADAVVRVRLSGNQQGVTPTKAMTAADQASRHLYEGTSLMQVTHTPDNVATRIAVLREDACILPEKPTALEVDLQSILTALNARDAAPAPSTQRRTTFETRGLS